MKRIILAALFLVVVQGGKPAEAGLRGGDAVVLGSNYAYGAIGNTRSSADPLAVIGCQLYAGSASSSASVFCWAGNNSGQRRLCTTNQPAIVQVATGIAADSNIYFEVTGGACTYLSIGTSSVFAPKLP